jgi:hypothetical protein
MRFPISGDYPFTWTKLEEDPLMKVHEHLPEELRTVIEHILQSEGDKVADLKVLAESNPAYKDNIYRVIQSEQKIRDIIRDSDGIIEDLETLSILTPTFKTHIDQAIAEQTSINAKSKEIYNAKIAEENRLKAIEYAKKDNLEAEEYAKQAPEREKERRRLRAERNARIVIERKKRLDEINSRVESTGPLRAPIPFDVYVFSLLRADPTLNFINSASPVSDDDNIVLNALNPYAEMIGLGDIIDYIEDDDLDHTPSAFIHEIWQSQSVSSVKEFERKLPEISSPIVAYRGYQTGIDMEIQPGMQDFGGRLRSLTLSQKFMNGFTGSNPMVIHSRVDVLNGIEVLPLFHYIDTYISTEFEVVVKMGRLHVFPKETVLEGRQQMPRWPTTKYNVDPNPLRLVDYYFVISKPGTNVEYNPDYEYDTTLSIVHGGGKTLQLNDQNALGIGNVMDLMDNYIKKRNQKITQKSYPASNPFRSIPRPKPTIKRGGRKTRRKRTRRRKLL